MYLNGMKRRMVGAQEKGISCWKQQGVEVPERDT